jgi:hypothetical protein
MNRPVQLSDLQVELASIFFALDATTDYLVGGGAALLASNLIDRPTDDLDLFAGSPTTTVTAAKDAYIRALGERCYDVSLVQDSPTFARMTVIRAGEQTLVDLAIDSPPRARTTITVLGPTLAPLELAGRNSSPSSGVPKPATSPTSTSLPNALPQAASSNRPEHSIQASTSAFSPK